MNDLVNKQQQEFLEKQWSTISEEKQVDLLIAFLEEGISKNDIFDLLLDTKTYRLADENIEEFLNKQLSQIDYPDFDKTIICLEIPNSGKAFLYESTYAQLRENYDFEFMLPILKAILCIGTDNKNKLVDEIRSQLVEQSDFESDTSSFRIFDDFKELTKDLINKAFSDHAYNCGLLTAVTKFRPNNIDSDDFADLMQLLCANDLVDTYRLSNFQKYKIWVFENEYKSWLIEKYTVSQIFGDDILHSSEDRLLSHVSEYVDSEAEFEYELSSQLGFLDELCIEGKNILFDCDKNEDIDFLRDCQHDIKDEVVKTILSFKDRGVVK